jgi:hypothetical protein
MEFYAYKGNKPLCQENLGSEGRRLLSDLKTVRSVINRIHDSWKSEGYMIYSFTNFYNTNTFTHLFTSKPQS